MAKALGIKRPATTPKKQVQIGPDLRITEENHDKLLEYLKKRLKFGNDGRDEYINRLKFIDQEYYGCLKLEPEDYQRMRDNLNMQGVKTTDFILEMTSSQLDAFSTYLTSVLSPDEELYTASAPRPKQAVANGFATSMNRAGAAFKHFPEISKAFLDMGKYNFGGWAPIEWTEVHGSKLQRAASGEVEIHNTIVMEGNKMPSIDPYNFLYDRSVNPIFLNTQGEFFIVPEVHTPFRIKRMIANQEIFGEDRFMVNGELMNLPIGEITYYEPKPEILINGVFNATPNNDFRTLWGSGSNTDETVNQEMLHFYIHIEPKKFGLSKEKGFQIWRFTTLSDRFIVDAEHLTNAHGLLPCAIAMPRYDGFQRASKSYAESLSPLQRFASNEMNVHQRSARKKMYGVTIYDAQFAPLMEKADLLGGKVPWNPTGVDRDIRKSFLQLNDTPETGQTMQNVEASQTLAQMILPTDTLGQVANLDRATTYQAAATVQAANRRPYKDAKTINTQALQDAKRIQLYNILQFQEAVTYTDDKTGEEVTVSATEFNEFDMEWIISSGIQGIDRLIIVEMFRDIINMLLQSKVGQDRVDIMGIIDYWTNQFGEKVDFKTFEFQSPIDALPPQLRDVAFQLLQQWQAQQEAGGAGNVQQLPGPGAGPAITQSQTTRAADAGA